MSIDARPECGESDCPNDGELEKIQHSTCDTCYLLMNPNDLMRKSELYLSWKHRVKHVSHTDIQAFHHQIGTLVNILKSYAELRLYGDVISDRWDLCKYYRVFLRIESLFTRISEHDIRIFCSLLQPLPKEKISVESLNNVLDTMDLITPSTK